MKNVDTVVSEIYTNGYSIVKNFINSKFLLDNLLSDIKNMRQEKMRSTISKKLIDSKLIISPHSSSINFLEIISNNYINDINKKLLNDPFYRIIDQSLPNYSLNFSMCRSSGEDSLGWHRDDRNPPNSSKEVCYLQFGLALEDSNRDNGCTRIIPKSHIIPTYVENVDNMDKINVIQEAGDLLIYDGRMWHAAHDNISINSRWIFFFGFARWHLKPTYDYTKNINYAILKNLSLEQKLILGFHCISKVNEDKNDFASQRGDLKFMELNYKNQIKSAIK